jgi:hypothetical protein
MRPTGRPKGEYRRAQPEGTPVDPHGRPTDPSRGALHEGTAGTTPGRSRTRTLERFKGKLVQ